MSFRGRLEDVVCELVRRAETTIPSDVESALRRALRREAGLARLQIETILENVKVARGGGVPLCQDTGILLFYVDVGLKSNVSLGDLTAGINAGVRRATKVVPLRPNIVHPLSRKNSGNNTGWGTPIIHLNPVEGEEAITLTVLPKGAGAENMSELRMLNPSEGVSGVKDFVVDVVGRAGGKPCPPTIVGVGLGGSADCALALAKKALLRPINVRNKDKLVARLEKEILSEVNSLGVGPMGLGGKTTSLGVNIEFSGCHTASLPVAVNLQCWAARLAKARITGEDVKWLR